MRSVFREELSRGAVENGGELEPSVTPRTVTPHALRAAEPSACARPGAPPRSIAPARAFCQPPARCACGAPPSARGGVARPWSAASGKGLLHSAGARGTQLPPCTRLAPPALSGARRWAAGRPQWATSGMEALR
jgi:hypothetical protein